VLIGEDGGVPLKA